MACGAPRATKAGMANRGPNAFPGGCMGAGCQGKIGVVAYAQAVPPSWNAGAIFVFEQRAYFSACRIVCEVPSAKSLGIRALPCGLVVGGVALRSFFADTRALGA